METPVILNSCEFCKHNSTPVGQEFGSCKIYNADLPKSKLCPRFDVDQERVTDKKDSSWSYIREVIADGSKPVELCPKNENFGVKEPFPIVIERTILGDLIDYALVFYPLILILITVSIILFSDLPLWTLVLTVPVLGWIQFTSLKTGGKSCFKGKRLMILEKDSFTIYPDFVGEVYPWDTPFLFHYYKAKQMNTRILRIIGYEMYHIRLSNTNRKPQEIVDIIEKLMKEWSSPKD